MLKPKTGALTSTASPCFGLLLEMYKLSAKSPVAAELAPLPGAVPTSPPAPLLDRLLNPSPDPLLNSSLDCSPVSAAPVPSRAVAGPKDKPLFTGWGKAGAAKEMDSKAGKKADSMANLKESPGDLKIILGKVFKTQKFLRPPKHTRPKVTGLTDPIYLVNLAIICRPWAPDDQ